MKVKKVIFILSLLTLFFVYLLRITFDKSVIQNLNGGEVGIIGHGGLGFAGLFPYNHYPANSYTSLSKALEEYKAEGVEVDVHMTLDGKFVLYHDGKLDSKTELSGCIESYNYKDIIGVEYQLGFPYDMFQSEKIIGLEALIKLCKEQEEFPFLHFDIRNTSLCLGEVENGEWEKNFIRLFIQRLDELELPKEKLLIISNSYRFLEHAIDLNCPYPLSLEVVVSFKEGVQWVLDRNIDIITVKPRLLTAEGSALAHSNGIQIITFGAKSKSGNKKLLKLNPDIIQTNNIVALQEQLN